MVITSALPSLAVPRTSVVDDGNIVECEDDGVSCGNNVVVEDCSG